MTDINDLSRMEINKFMLKQDNELYINAKAYRKFGLWAAEKLGLKDEEAHDYAMSLVVYELDNKNKSTAIDKVIDDLKMDKYDVKDKLEEFIAKARKEVMGE